MDAPGRTFRNPTLVRRIMHINELTTGLCIIMSVHVTIIILGKIHVADRRLNIIMLYHAFWRNRAKRRQRFIVLFNWFQRLL